MSKETPLEEISREAAAKQNYAAAVHAVDDDGAEEVEVAIKHKAKPKETPLVEAHAKAPVTPVVLATEHADAQVHAVAKEVAEEGTVAKNDKLVSKVTPHEKEPVKAVVEPVDAATVHAGAKEDAEEEKLARKKSLRPMKPHSKKQL